MGLGNGIFDLVFDDPADQYQRIERSLAAGVLDAFLER